MALATLGFSIQGEPPHLRITYPSVATVVSFPIADLATGLIAMWARGTDLALWASVVLMVDRIDVADLDSVDGQVLINALWDAAGGGLVSDEAINTAHRIAAT